MRRARAVLLTALAGGLVVAGGASAAPAQVELRGGDVCVWVVKDGRPVGYCLRPAG